MSIVFVLELLLIVLLPLLGRIVVRPCHTLLASEMLLQEFVKFGVGAYEACVDVVPRHAATLPFEC